MVKVLRCGQFQNSPVLIIPGFKYLFDFFMGGLVDPKCVA